MSRYTKTSISVYMDMIISELQLWVDDINKVIEEEDERMKQSNG